MATGQVIGDSILDPVHIGDPIVGADVGDIEEVEHIEAEPYTLEMAQEAFATLTIFERRKQTVLQSYIDTLIGWSTEIALITCGTWRSCRQTIVEDSA